MAIARTRWKWLLAASIVCAAVVVGARTQSLEPRGLPFGPWHLPDDSFHTPFSGAIRGAHPDDVMATLEAARRAGFRVIVRLDRGRKRFSNADGSFNLALWKKEIDRYHGIDFAPYVKDGTLLGHFLFDEPDDPTNWNGHPVPYAVIESTAAYSKRLWPTLPTGVGASAVFLQGGGRWTDLDFTETQYRPKKGDVRQWLATQVAAARAAHLGLALSINVLDGNGRGQPLSGAQLRTFGLVLAEEPSACGLFMWKYDEHDPKYFQRQEVRAAAADIGRVTAGRRAQPCTRQEQAEADSEALKN
jgi:hypothetical protein